MNLDTPESDYLYSEISRIQNSGMGLFTAIDIYKDEVIAIFKGEILTEHEAEIRAKNGADKYFMNMPDGSILDTMNVAGYAKYANDANGSSLSSFKNNAKIAFDEDDNVCIIAICKIHSGDEIYCAYGKKYWKKHGFT